LIVPLIDTVGGEPLNRIEFFESAAEPVADAVWRDLAEVRRVPLGEQTRVYFKDGNGRWRAGRVVGGDDMAVYHVRVPNQQWDVDIAESRLRVRWEKAPRDPLQVLLSGANALRGGRERNTKLSPFQSGSRTRSQGVDVTRQPASSALPRSRPMSHAIPAGEVRAAPVTCSRPTILSNVTSAPRAHQLA